MLGGSVGIAIANSVWNGYVRSTLDSVLSNTEISGLMVNIGGISTLPENKQFAVRRIFAEGYNIQMKVTVAFAAAQFLVAALIWRRQSNQLRLSLEGMIKAN
jgi:hypothetical protein